MSAVTISDEVMEKVNIKCRQSNKTPFEVINEVLLDTLGKVDEIPDDIDGDKIWNLLEHDKPEGDDILERLCGIVSCDEVTDSVEMKKNAYKRG